MLLLIGETYHVFSFKKLRYKQGNGNILFFADAEFFKWGPWKSVYNQGDFRNKLGILQLHSCLQTTSNEMAAISKPFQIKAKSFCFWSYFTPFKNKEEHFHSSLCRLLIQWVTYWVFHKSLCHASSSLSFWFWASPFESYCKNALGFDASPVADIPVREVFLVDVHTAVHVFFSVTCIII